MNVPSNLTFKVKLVKATESTNNHAAEEILSRPINITPNSECSFRLARSWLNIRLEEHELCPKPRRDFMPAGLIHIEDERGSQYPRPRNADLTNYKPYATLSYY